MAAGSSKTSLPIARTLPPSFDLIIDVFPCIITRIVCQFPQGRPPRVYVPSVCVYARARVTRHYASIQAYVKRTDRDQAFSLVIIPICWKMWPAPGDNTRLFRIILFQLVHVFVMSLRKDDVIIILIFVSFFPINHVGSITLVGYRLLIKRNWLFCKEN